MKIGKNFSPLDALGVERGRTQTVRLMSRSVASRSSAQSSYLYSTPPQCKPY